MPDVVLRFRADSAEALAKIQQFSRGVEDNFRKVQAGDPALRTAAASTKALAAAKGEAAHATDVFTRALTGVPGPLGQAAAQVASLRGFLVGPAGLAAGVLAAGAAVVTLGNQFAGSIERLDNLSTQTGLSVGALQALEQAAREAGESPDALVQGFGKLNSAIADAILQGEKVSPTYKAIGIDLQALVKSGLSTEQIFEKVAHSVAGIENPTQRAAIQMELFGLRGRGVSTVIDAIARDGLPAYIAKMRDAGIVTSDAANTAAREWDKATDEIGRFFRGLLTEVQGVAAQMVLAVVHAARDASRGLEAIRQQAGAGTGLEGITGVGVEGITVQGGAPRRSRREDDIIASLTGSTVIEAVRKLAEQAPKLNDFRTMLGGLGDSAEDLGRAAKIGIEDGLLAQMEKLPDEIERVVESLELFKQASVITPHDFERGLGALIDFLEEIRGKSPAAERALLRLKVQAQQTEQAIARLLDVRTMHGGLLDTAEDIGRAASLGIQQAKEAIKPFAETLKTELATGLAAAIAAAARTGDIGGAFESLGQRLGQQAGGAFSQALTQVLTGQTTATTTGDLVTSGGVVVGTTAGTAIGGGGGGASTGAAIGSVVGGVAGGYFTGGNIFGIAGGAIVGGVAGGYLGGLFDPSDLEQALHDFRSRLRDQTSLAFGEGVMEAVKTGDVDGAFEHVADNLTEIIQGAVITAFVETAVIKGAMGPLIDAISDAMEQGLGPTAFMRHIMPGLEQFRGRLDMLRPLFGEMVGVFGDIGQILHGNATVTDQWRTSLEGAADVASDIRGSIEAIPSDINVNVHREGGGGEGFQQGGVITRGTVQAVLHGPEVIYPLDRFERMLDHVSGNPEVTALLREQNGLLREQNGLLRMRTRRGAPV